MWWHSKFSLLTDAHVQKSSLPSGNDLPHSELESKLLLVLVPENRYNDAFKFSFSISLKDCDDFGGFGVGTSEPPLFY